MEDPIFENSTISIVGEKNTKTRTSQKGGRIQIPNPLCLPQKRTFSETTQISFEKIDQGLESNESKKPKRTTVEDWEQLKETPIVVPQIKGHSEFFSEDVLPPPQPTTKSTKTSSAKRIPHSQQFTIPPSASVIPPTKFPRASLPSTKTRLKQKPQPKKVFYEEENNLQECFKTQALLMLQEEYEEEKYLNEVQNFTQEIKRLEEELSLKNRIVEILIQLEEQIGPMLPPPSTPGDEGIPSGPLPPVLSLTSHLDPLLAIKESVHWNKNQHKNFVPAPILFKELKDNLKKLEALEKEIVA